MTPIQLKALCEYTEAVCSHMLHYATDPASEHRRYRAARANLERAFGARLPSELPAVDLFAEFTEVPAHHRKPSGLPDIL